ncbi:MAG: ligase 1 [Actinomycetota bacterium]|jgi:DNA ligase-1|nr:ligase 1 [Actinomycetota bacterium]
MVGVLLASLVSTSSSVASTRSRSAKVAALASAIAALASSSPGSLACGVAFLTGAPQQGRIGVGWASLKAAFDVVGAAPASPTLTVADVDGALTSLAAIGGPGSGGVRLERLRSLLSLATEAEREFLWRLVTGELRQGALEGVVADAVARAAGVPLALVRRAAMLAGDLPRVAVVAMTSGAAGLEAVGLTPMSPIQPMLASTASSVSDAVSSFGGAEVSIEWKLDGIRIQAHRSGAGVRLFTRNLNDVTAGLASVAGVVASLPCESVVLDGEVVGPVVRFFDCLHVDGRDLIDLPLVERHSELARIAGEWRVPSLLTTDAAAAVAFEAVALAEGHEGVMVKGAASLYEAGRRGGSWKKVKPFRTFDLVVLAAEWGHGRRQGWLSNLHLGARSDDGSGFVMVGKTFKGMTDEILRWQTETLSALATETHRWGVTVSPTLVVEVAIDGVQPSPRYPGGVALRFARIKGYRPDKPASDADTISSLQALLSNRG